MVDENSEREHREGPARRRKLGVSMRVPGVAVHLEQETVGEITERYIDDEQRDEKRYDFLKLLSSVLAAVLGLVATAGDVLPLGGNAIALVAGVVGVGVLSAALLVTDSVQERSSPSKPQPLTPNLRSLRGDLAAMRQPILQRSRSDSTTEE